jgi:hypothetical protein
VEVKLGPLGCVGVLGAVLSFGLSPLVRRRHERQYPGRLLEDAMVLRDGTRIPWRDITRVWKSETYSNQRWLFTQFVITHVRGKVKFPSHRLQDARAVLGFIVAHLPSGVTVEDGAPTVLFRRR